MITCLHLSSPGDHPSTLVGEHGQLDPVGGREEYAVALEIRSASHVDGGGQAVAEPLGDFGQRA